MKNLIKNVLAVSLMLFSMWAFASDNVPYTLAKNYFVKNSYPDKNLHMLKITSEVQFDEIFGMAALMGEAAKPTPIDFSKTFVIALIDEISNQSAGISVKSLVKENGGLKLLYSLQRNEKPGSADFRYSTILIVDKKYEAPVSANGAPQNGQPILGGDLDDSGCKPSTGHSWSILENDCIQPWETKYVFAGEIGNASLIFSKDNKKAEIISSSHLPKNLVLTKKAKENSWANGNIVLTQIKKDSFILKEKNKEIAKGKLRN